MVLKTDKNFTEATRTVVPEVFKWLEIRYCTSLLTLYAVCKGSMRTATDKMGWLRTSLSFLYIGSYYQTLLCKKSARVCMYVLTIYIKTGNITGLLSLASRVCMYVLTIYIKTGNITGLLSLASRVCMYVLTIHIKTENITGLLSLASRDESYLWT